MTRNGRKECRKEKEMRKERGREGDKKGVIRMVEVKGIHDLVVPMVAGGRRGREGSAGEV